MILHRHLPSFDGRSQFTTWLYQVTRSAAGDLHRKRRRRQRLAEAAIQVAGPDVVDPREVENADEKRATGLVKMFLQELSERQREIFDLCDLQGFGAVCPARGGVLGYLDAGAVPDDGLGVTWSAGLACRDGKDCER